MTRLKETIASFVCRYARAISFVLFFVALFYMDTAFRICYRFAGNTPVFSLVPLIFTLCWALFLSSVTALLPRPVLSWVRGLLLGLFFLFYYTCAILHLVSECFLSFSDLAFAEDGVSFLSVTYLAIPFYVYLHLAVFLALGVASIVIGARAKKVKIRTLVICLCLAIGAVAGIAFHHTAHSLSMAKKDYFWKDEYDPNSDEAIYTEFSDPNRCLLYCGGYQYLFRSTTDSVFDFFRFSSMRADLEAFYARRPATRSNEMTGVLEGQNFIAVLLESIDTWMVNEDFMPNFYALQKEGVDFTNHYTPLFLSAGTFNTEFAVNCGYYLPVTGTSARTYAVGVFPQSLPHLFSAKGYHANSYHALDGRFYNRCLVHPQWGYEKFWDHNDMNLQGNIHKDSTLLEAYDLFAKNDGPFFSYLISYSGHGPYTAQNADISDSHIQKARDAVERRGIQSENPDTQCQYIYAVAHAMETDAMIGQLIERMRNDGSLHDTALLFFGDHYAKYLTDTDFLMQLKGVSDINLLCRTPMVLYSERLGAMRVTKATDSVDILPTVANLFGLDYDASHLVGSDIFGDGEEIVVFKDFSYLDSKHYYTPDTDGDASPAVRQKAKEAHGLLTASWNTIKTNYFKE